MSKTYRQFIGYITPKVGGADRQVEVRAYNFGEAEALVATLGGLNEDEFISSISQEFPDD